MLTKPSPIGRAFLVDMAVNAVPYSAINDLPMIRMALNDMADCCRRDGYTVPDYSQDIMVKAVQRGLLNK